MKLWEIRTSSTVRYTRWKFIARSQAKNLKNYGIDCTVTRVEIDG